MLQLSINTRKIWSHDLATSFGNLEKSFRNSQDLKLQRSWVAAYIFIFWSLAWIQNSPRPKLSKAFSLSHRNGFKLGELSDFLTPALRSHLQIFRNYWDLPLDEILSRGLLRGLPEPICRFFSHLWPVQVLSRVPEGREILGWQQQGRRCVSLISDEKILANGSLHDKDPFAFAIHDIEHAYKFFHDSSSYRSQVGFYLLCGPMIPKIQTFPFWNEAEFQKDFNYLISDMNSHSVHMIKTLHAIILKAFKKHYGLQHLSSEFERQFFKLWQSLLQTIVKEAEDLKLLSDVNQKNISSETEKRIENYFSRMSQIAAPEFFFNY